MRTALAQAAWKGASYFLDEKRRFLLYSIFRNRIRIHSSGYEPFAAFSAAVFSFLSSNSTYLYCTVRLCRAESSNCNSSCGATQATSSSWKQKRSTSIDETDEINLKLGPLLINNQKSKSELNGRGWFFDDLGPADLSERLSVDLKFE